MTFEAQAATLEADQPTAPFDWNQLETFCLNLAREIHTGQLQPQSADSFPGLFRAALKELAHTDFSPSQAAVLQSEIHRLLERFQRIPRQSADLFANLANPFERICLHIAKVGDDILAERNTREVLPRLEILRDPLPADWTQCLEEYDIPDITRLPPSCYPVYYIGGTARVLARHFMGFKNPSGELPVTDYDFLLSNEQAVHTLCDTFAHMGVDPKGVKIHPDFGDDPNDYFCNGDVSFNQILLGVNILGEQVFYRTAAADRALDTGLIRPVSETVEDFYNIHFYRHPEEPHVRIYSPAILERVHKFVVENKSAGFYLEDHNLRIPMGSRHLVGIRRHLSAPAREQPLRFRRLASIFHQTENVPVDNFFDHLDFLLTQKYPNFHMKPVPPGQADKAKWFVSLLIRVLMRGVGDPFGEVASHYQQAPNQEERHQRMILVDPESRPDTAFEKRFWEWRANDRFPALNQAAL